MVEPRKTTRPVLLLGVALAVVLSGCDRDWAYRVAGLPILADGSRFNVQGPADTRLRVAAGLFCVGLWIGVDLQNAGDSPLHVEPGKVFVIRGNERLPLRRPARCEGRAEEEVVLAKGESCHMVADALAYQSDSDLREVTLVHLGVSRDGNPVRLVIPLVRH